ncbi:hypothetical protein YC2023_053991 [Brassica napus]
MNRCERPTSLLSIGFLLRLICGGSDGGASSASPSEQYVLSLCLAVLFLFCSNLHFFLYTFSGFRWLRLLLLTTIKVI